MLKLKMTEAERLSFQAEGKTVLSKRCVKPRPTQSIVRGYITKILEKTGGEPCALRCSGMFGRKKIPKERRYQKREDTKPEKNILEESPLPV